eukprot:CAMPEP_0172582600 /NCGR_PEP_ID=MMETSP1068-20121228/2086_1 /TAXON_ID=35684 /ORGANISM="Pseudopedinella elastica, Strain CCMP716" /LENGTH=33 /DNA_ID= /DNA_START= /DNA_END= /DNA_ORIENTATION=
MARFLLAVLFASQLLGASAYAFLPTSRGLQATR